MSKQRERQRQTAPGTGRLHATRQSRDDLVHVDLLPQSPSGGLLDSQHVEQAPVNVDTQKFVTFAGNICMILT
jgi:hypothetical protein